MGLLEAVRKGDRQAVIALVRKGCNPIMQVDCGFGLHQCNIVDWAVYNEHEAIAVQLLQLGDEVGVAQELAAQTKHAVFWAIVRGYSNALRSLLDFNADPAQRNR